MTPSRAALRRPPAAAPPGRPAAPGRSSWRPRPSPVVAEGRAEDPLAAPEAVDLGGVEEGDAELERPAGRSRAASPLVVRAVAPLPGAELPGAQPDLGQRFGGVERDETHGVETTPMSRFPRPIRRHAGPRARLMIVTYLAADDRYDTMTYRRSGRSGLRLPADLARAVAQLRPGPPVRAAARHRPPRLRPRRHPLRPGQQLRPAARLGGGELRPDARHRPEAVPGRAGHLQQGRVPHVARPVRRVGLAQVPDLLAGPVAAPDGAGLRRHLLLAPLRPGHPAGGDDGRAGRRRPLRQGALRRHLQLQLGADRAGRRDPARAGHAAADQPAVVLDAQPLDRARRPARHAGAGRRGLHRVQPAGPGPADRPLPGRHPGRLAGAHQRLPQRERPQRGEDGHASGRSARSPSGAASRWPSSRWPGRCATRG